MHKHGARIRRGKADDVCSASKTAEWWIGQRVRIIGGCEDHRGCIGIVDYVSTLTKTVVRVILDKPVDPPCECCCECCSVFVEHVEIVG